jgi:transcriptional regulator with XRE-family HTH domain
LNAEEPKCRIAALSGELHKAKGVNPMVIGTRLRELREQKGLSQGDVEKATGLKRCYTSRVEHGHTVPSLTNLEKYAAGLGVPMYRLFYEGEEPPPRPKLTRREDLQELAKEPGKKGSEAKFLLKLKKLLAKVEEPDRAVFLAMVQKLAAAKR